MRAWQADLSLCPVPGTGRLQLAMPTLNYTLVTLTQAVSRLNYMYVISFTGRLLCGRRRLIWAPPGPGVGLL